MLLLKKALEKTNADIIQAENGKDAVKLFRTNPDIDVILMDIRMPIMDGIEATTQIKQIDDNIPIIVQTAFTMSSEKEKSFKAGDYLVVKELILKLHENEQKNIQIIQLKQELDYSIDYKIEQLVSEANKNYTNGQFYQAIDLWEQVLIYDPQNTRAKKNIRRAEEVIDKLIRLREKN